MVLAAFAVLFVVSSCSDDDEGGASLNYKVSQTEMTFGKDGGTQSLYIVASGTPTVSSSASWCSVEYASSTSSGTYTYSVTATANSETSQRTATLTVKTPELSETVTVTQAAADGLTLDKSSVTLSSSSSESFQVTVSANGTVTVTINASWITEDSADESTGIYTFTASTNYLEERTGTIDFTVGDLTATLTVTQPSGVSSDMSSDAKTLASKMYAGINIGNTLEATGGETSWGNPKVNATYIAGLKNLGFNAVRIPCAWDSHLSDESTYEIDPDWMDRVVEVVGYCVDNDMYAIVNIHWDGGWLEDNITSGYNSDIDAEQKALWTQIATALGGYDEHVLFAAMNEPGMNETSGSSSVSTTAVQTIMTYQQTFVDAVRATGGNNATRCLVVQGPATDINFTVEVTYGVPTDTATDRLMVEVHYYDPYQFTLMEEDATWGKTFWYWGSDNYVSGSDHNATWGEESWVTAQFDKMKTSFVDKGYPVIIGEFCAMKRTVSENQQKHNDSRKYFNEVVTREAKNRGIVPFYWETGTDINRSDGSAKEDYAIEGIMTGAAEGNYPF